MRFNHLNGRPLIEELENLRQWTEQPTVPFLYLEILYAAPAKPTAGMVVYADGTTWNPGGTGEGIYRYSLGGAWVLVG